LEKRELKSVANLGAYESELDEAADLTLIPPINADSANRWPASGRTLDD